MSSPLAFHLWPFELFAHLSSFLTANDLLSLRLVNRGCYRFASDRAPWRALAIQLSKEIPITLEKGYSLHSLVHSDSTDISTLIKCLTTAERVYTNFIVRPQPRLRKILVFQPGAQYRWDSMSALMRPGSRHLISTQYFAEEKYNRLSISDIHMEIVLGEWKYDYRNTLLTYREVEHGSAIMFLFNPGYVTENGLHEYEFVRFEFSPDPLHNPMGRFLSHSLFRQPKQITDLTLSEEFLIILDVDAHSVLVLECLNWRTGQMGRVKTGLVAPTEPYNLNITGDHIALWVHQGVNSIFYNFPLSLLYHSLDPSIDEVQAPLSEPIPFKFEDTIRTYIDSGWQVFYSQRTRLWETTKNNQRITDRRIQVLQFWKAPNEEISTGGTNGDNSLTLALARYCLPVVFDSKPIRRTWITKRRMVVAVHPTRLPISTSDQRHTIWCEVNPITGRRELKLCNLPLWDEEDRMPEYWDEQGGIKTIPVPTTFDLKDLEKLTLDEPSGCLNLTFKDGRLWLLYYDGYDDERYNISKGTLEVMFPNHDGAYCLDQSAYFNETNASGAGGGGSGAENITSTGTQQQQQHADLLATAAAAYDEEMAMQIQEEYYEKELDTSSTGNEKEDHRMAM